MISVHVCIYIARALPYAVYNNVSTVNVERADMNVHGDRIVRCKACALPATTKPAHGHCGVSMQSAAGPDRGLYIDHLHARKNIIA